MAAQISAHENTKLKEALDMTTTLWCHFVTRATKGVVVKDFWLVDHVREWASPFIWYRASVLHPPKRPSTHSLTGGHHSWPCPWQPVRHKHDHPIVDISTRRVHHALLHPGRCARRRDRPVRPERPLHNPQEDVAKGYVYAPLRLRSISYSLIFSCRRSRDPSYCLASHVLWPRRSQADASGRTPSVLFIGPRRQDTTQPCAAVRVLHGMPARHPRHQLQGAAHARIRTLLNLHTHARVLIFPRSFQSSGRWP
jgi:hypothetical protein